MKTRFDYERQCWVVNDVVARCGHKTGCGCYGRLHAGEVLKEETPAQIERAQGNTWLK
jgi:hypothetical protein